MFLNEMYLVAKWYLAVTLIGFSVLPLTYKLLGNLKDKGYGASKILGLVVFSYVSWIFANLGVLPFNNGSIWVLVLAGLLATLFYQQKSNFLSSYTQNWRNIFFQEVLFLFLLFLLIFFRAEFPKIESIEKIMDYAILNGLLRAQYMPPTDVWFSNQIINYYYFGHYVIAFVLKFTGIPNYIGYNIAVAHIFAASGSLIFWNIYNLCKKYWVGLLGTLLLCFSGNLDYFYKTVILNNKNYFYAEARSLIEFTINEFPTYSFLISDLHAHILNIPFTLVFLGIFYSFYLHFTQKQNLLNAFHKPTFFEFYKTKKPKIAWDVATHPLTTFHEHSKTSKLPASTENQTLAQNQNFYLKLIFLAFFLGIFFITNSWEFITYSGMLFGFFIIFTLLAFLQNAPELAENKIKKERSLIIKLFGLLGFFLLILALGFFFAAPYYFNFDAPTTGFGIVQEKSPFKQIVVMFGYFALIALPYLIFQIYKNYKVIDKFTKQQLHKINVKKLKKQSVVSKFKKLNILGALQLATKKATTNIKQTNKNNEISFMLTTELFVVILAVYAFILVAIPEFFFLKDIYYDANPPYFRANTVFKVWYHAWILFCIVAPFAFYKFTKILNQRLNYKKQKILLYFGKYKYKEYAKTVLATAYFISIIYLGYYVIYYTYDSVDYIFGTEYDYKNLDGTEYLITQNLSGQRDAIFWINQNIKGQPIILEAYGESYKIESLFSAYTGLPTPVGWVDHQFGWRGSFDEIAILMGEIELMYTSPNLPQVQQLIAKNNIEYAVIGPIEKQKFGEFSGNTIRQIGRLIYENEQVEIYKL